MSHKTIAITILMVLFIAVASVAMGKHPLRAAPHTSEGIPIESIDLQEASKPKEDATNNFGLVELLVSNVISTPLISISAFSLETLQRTSDPLSRRNQEILPRPNSTMGTCTVTTTADSGSGTFRQCLWDSIIGGTVGTIDFDPQVFPPATPATIAPLSPFLIISTDGLTIDASNAGVILDGSELSLSEGLVIYGADGVTIQGLQILNFPLEGILLMEGATNAVIGGDRQVGAAPLGQGNLISNNGSAGIWLEGTETAGNRVLGNYIGTDLNGSAASGNDSAGIVIAQGAHDNEIGGETEGLRNVISGNNGLGIQIQNSGSDNNRVLGNYIGTDATGQAALGNSDGIGILDSAKNNVIGGQTEGARNVISGNSSLASGRGIVIQDTGTISNTVQGNYIGTDATGTQPIGNDLAGILLTRRFGSTGASNNIIGGNTPGMRNLISGNGGGLLGGGYGILMAYEGTSENQILGNYIGTDVTGTEALGNNFSGITILGHASHNDIGVPSAGNLISGNQQNGIFLLADPLFGGEGPTENLVRGNRIGTDASGTIKIPNEAFGVVFHDNATNNVIGGNIPSQGNLISGNQGGILISETEDNHILGNYIGTDVTAQSALGNESAGILIVSDGKNNVIGGAELARNIISGNNGPSIQIQGSEATGNLIIGNYIGTDLTGTLPLSNSAGIAIGLGASDNVIGGETATARNIISGNSGPGVHIQSSGTTGNQVLGNYIGTDATGTQSLGNGGNGLAITQGASNNLIGGPSSGNLISGNGLQGNDDSLPDCVPAAGICLYGPATTNNQITGNYVGTNASGSDVIVNVGAGIHLQSGASANTIGSSNIIAYDGLAGIAIDGGTGLGNTITRNVIYGDGGLPINWTETESIPASPTLTSYEDNVLSGSACGSCLVEVFAGQSNLLPEGRVFLAEVIADSNGEFTFTLDAPAENYLSATAKDSEGNTSEFSSALQIGEPGGQTPTPTVGSSTPTATPTVGSSTPTSTPTVGSSTPTATPTVGSSTPTVGSRIYLPIVIK